MNPDAHLNPLELFLICPPYMLRTEKGFHLLQIFRFFFIWRDLGPAPGLAGFEAAQRGAGAGATDGLNPWGRGRLIS